MVPNNHETSDETREKLQREIDALPKGSVVYKRINGKSQPYLQWREKGRTKSRYLKIGERDMVLAQVTHRKALQQELAALSQTQALHSPSAHTIAGTRHPFGAGISLDTFETNVSTGQALSTFGAQVKGWRRRNCYPALWQYLEGSDARVCVVYGLRRTGKTTLLAQAIGDMTEEQRMRAAYVKCRRTDDMGMLNRDLRRLQALGFTAVFIDELTLLADFITDAAVLSDVYAAQGMRLVLSGTDSLAFWLARQDELYDRAVMLHTTFIPFHEHSRLLGTNDIDDYIAYGGTLRRGVATASGVSEDLAFADDESTRMYIDTAIAKNVQRSLAFYEDGGHYARLSRFYEAGELTSAINRIIEDMNHRFVREVVMGPFKSHDYGIAARNLRTSDDPGRQSVALDYLDRDTVTAALMKKLDILDRSDLSLEMDEGDLAVLHDYLMRLDLVAQCSVETAGRTLSRRERDVVVQPGMRFCQARALVDALMENEDFAGLPEWERTAIAQAVEDDVRGRMLEDIVLFETQRALPPNQKAFRLELSV
ncbi:MAG: AAA family ATPase, partial [Eggerthellaceae bacterium]|nr:AAA family ATPase [Eggerthellaceae bacterium]